MAFQRPYTMTLMSPMFLFCLVAVLNNFVTMSCAREPKSSLDYHDPKEVTIAGGHDQKGGEVVQAGGGDPNKINNIPNTPLDKNQLTFPFPFMFPFPHPITGISRLPLLRPAPVIGVPPFPFPFPPFGIPGVPPFPFPPLSIPGVPSVRVPQTTP